VKTQEVAPQQLTLHELIRQASVEQDREKLSDLQQKIGAAFERGESWSYTSN
jgi:hypothetical protein